MCAHFCLSLAVRVHDNTRGVYWAEGTLLVWFINDSNELLNYYAI